MGNISLILTHQTLNCIPLTIWRHEIALNGDKCIYVHYNDNYSYLYACCVLPPDVKQKIIFKEQDYSYSKDTAARFIEETLATERKNSFYEIFCEGNLTKSAHQDITEEAHFFAHRFCCKTLYIFTETEKCVAAWHDHWTKKQHHVPAYAGSKKEIKEIKTNLTTPRTINSELSDGSVLAQPNDNYSLRHPNEESTMQYLSNSISHMFSSSPKEKTPQTRTSEEHKASFDIEDIDNIQMTPNPFFRGFRFELNSNKS